MPSSAPRPRKATMTTTTTTAQALSAIWSTTIWSLAKFGKTRECRKVQAECQQPSRDLPHKLGRKHKCKAEEVVRVGGS